jgi:hypothetical protein
VQPLLVWGTRGLGEPSAVADLLERPVDQEVAVRVDVEHRVLDDPDRAFLAVERGLEQLGQLHAECLRGCFPPEGFQLEQLCLGAL